MQSCCKYKFLTHILSLDFKQSLLQLLLCAGFLRKLLMSVYFYSSQKQLDLYYQVFLSKDLWKIDKLFAFKTDIEQKDLKDQFLIDWYTVNKKTFLTSKTILSLFSWIIITYCNLEYEYYHASSLMYINLNEFIT